MCLRHLPHCHLPGLHAVGRDGGSKSTLKPQSIQVFRFVTFSAFLLRNIFLESTSLSLLQRKLRVKFISLPRKCRETCRSALTLKKVDSRNTFRQRRHFFRTSTSSRKNETLFGFSDTEEAATEQRDHLLAEAKSEILKQDCKVDTLNTCIREFQSMLIPNVWKWIT